MVILLMAIGDFFVIISYITIIDDYFIKNYYWIL
jgi:hypothetical protein